MVFRHRNNEHLTSEIRFYACCTLRVFAALWVTKEKEKEKGGVMGSKKHNKALQQKLVCCRRCLFPLMPSGKLPASEGGVTRMLGGGLGLSKVILYYFFLFIAWWINGRHSCNYVQETLSSWVGGWGTRRLPCEILGKQEHQRSATGFIGFIVKYRSHINDHRSLCCQNHRISSLILAGTQPT